MRHRDDLRAELKGWLGDGQGATEEGLSERMMAWVVWASVTLEPGRACDARQPPPQSDDTSRGFHLSADTLTCGFRKITLVAELRRGGAGGKARAGEGSGCVYNGTQAV